MSLLKEIPDKGATVAWSPVAAHSSLLAVGTKDVGSGTGFDDVGGELDIFSIDLSSTAERLPQKVMSTKTKARFSCLTWGGRNGSGPNGQGILAGGMQVWFVSVGLKVEVRRVIFCA